MGLVAMLLYTDVALGLVMVLAMTLNLMLAALMGVLIPMTMLQVRPRSGGRLVGADHRGDRFRRLFHLPGARDAVPDPLAGAR